MLSCSCIMISSDCVFGDRQVFFYCTQSEFFVCLIGLAFFEPRDLVLTKVQPEKNGHCPPQHTPSKSPKHHNILCFFFPQISLAVSLFPNLTAKYSQSQFRAVFPRFSPPFELPVSVYISGYGLCSRNVLYQTHFYTHISSIPKLFRYS